MAFLIIRGLVNTGPGLLFIHKSRINEHACYKVDKGEDEEECESSNSDEDDNESLVRLIHGQHITTKIAAVWRHRKKTFNNDCAITGWILSTIPQIREDVMAQMKGWHHDSAERVIKKLYAHDIDIDIDTMCDTFWNEFKHFQYKTGNFSSATRWNTADAINGNSYLWHAKYLRPWTDVLGHVACIVTSKRLGIGLVERAWKDVKHIKSGYASHIKAEQTEKQSMIYTTARVEEARVMAESMENATGRTEIAWTDNDTSFDFQLEKFGIDTFALSTIVIPKRRFCCWVEDWEKPLFEKNHILSETKLLEKYKDLVFHCPDDNILFTAIDKMSFI